MNFQKHKLNIEPFFLLSFVSFFASLMFQGFATENRSIGGLMCLLGGWWTLIDGCIAWLANPLLLITWLLRGLKLRMFATFLAVFTIFLMLTFLGTPSVVINEAGHKEQIVNVGFGFWLWVTSGVLILISLLSRKKNLSD